MPSVKIVKGLAYLEGFSDKQLEQLRSTLVYQDKSAEFAYKKFRKARWFASQYGDQAFQFRLDEMKKAVNRHLLVEEDGKVYTYTGLLDVIRTVLKATGEVAEVLHEPTPAFNPLPFKHPLPTLRPYQVEAVAALANNPHSAIEHGTGSGKSITLTKVIRDAGLKTVLMVPSKSIGHQMYDTLRYYLGDNKVGFYGDGKKEFKKQVTVGIAASLTKIEPGSPAWESLSKAEVFCTDEAHFLAADTFEKVAMGLLAGARYRWSVSGTQTRGDGAELLLQGLIGPIVSRLTVREAVDQGYLAKPMFRMIKVPSQNSYYDEDPNNMTRVHLYQNPAVLRTAGTMATQLTRIGHQVVILIDEVEQFTRLLPHLQADARFAHGGLTKDNRGKVPEAYWDSDPKALVKAFNNREFPILVGTSCIATGTDILPVDTIFYLVGGRSFIGVSQAVGRGTRKVGTKDTCNFIDFMPQLYIPSQGIDDSGEDQRSWSCLKRHAYARLQIYDSIYGPPTLS